MADAHRRLCASSALAGVLIAIGCLFSMSVAQYGPLAQGVCFSVGLFGVIECGAQLFTGLMLRITSVWEHKYTISVYIMLQIHVWMLNLLGALIVALMAFVIGVDAAPVAIHKASMPWSELIIRAILCNVMVCMTVYIVRRSANTTVDALASVLLPVACFVACGWEHSVADMLYMPLGLMQGAVSVADCLRVVALATVGNVIGGAAFARLVWEGKR